LNIACLSVHSSPLGKPGTKDTGGMSTYLRELSLALGKLDCRVDLFTAYGDGCQEKICAVGAGSRLITIPISCNYESKLDLYPHLGLFAGEVDRLSRKEKRAYDLIFSHYWLSGLVGNKLKEIWEVPHLIMFHTLGAVKNGLCSAEKEPDIRLREEQNLIAECDRVLVAARREKQELCRYYQANPDKIAVISCGVNLDLFKPLAPEPNGLFSGWGEDKVILYAGRIEPIKGLDLLLHAAAYLRDRGCQFKLLIAGGDRHSTHLENGYRQMARELGLAEQVIFLGLVEHTVLPRYYNKADVTVLPSYYESFGMTALESLACGTPVVATDVGDLKNIIVQGRTGNVIAKRAPDRLAEAIISLFDLPQKPVALCRTAALSFGWPEVARQMINEFADMADKKEHKYG